MWANYYSSDNALYAHPTKQDAIRRSFGQAKLNAIPVAVIPLHEPTALGDSMVSALTSLGVLPKPRKGGRK